METNLKKQRGFTTIDITVAMIVIIIFVSIVASISYSIYSSSTEATRTANALNYAVDIFECIGQLDFDNVTANRIQSRLPEINMTIGTKSGDTTTGTLGKGKGYEYTLTIEDPKGDGYVKLITLEIKYKVSAKNTQSMTLQRVKANV